MKPLIKFLSIMLTIFFAMAATNAVAMAATATNAVVCHENSSLRDLPNKDAILLVNSGTARKAARENGIASVAADIQRVYPKIKIITAFTDRDVIARIKSTDKINPQTPEEALAELNASGYTRVVVAPISVTPDADYAYALRLCENHADRFKKIVCAAPLMHDVTEDDNTPKTAAAISAQFMRLEKKEGILLVANAAANGEYYSRLREEFAANVADYVYVCVADGTPGIDDAIAKMKADKINSVILMPATVSIDDAVEKYLSGENSYRELLSKAGFKTKVYMHGLSENPALRRLFLERIDEGFKVLREKKFAG